MSPTEHGSEGNPQAAVTFLTTEHFTLQGARASAVAESTGRLQLYMGVLSSFILTLALVAQVAEFGERFFTLALALLAIVYFLGLATIGRLQQIWLDWFVATQGMNRIRRYFVDQAHEVAPYLSLPTSDDPLRTLTGVGIQVRGRWWQGFVTAFAVVGVVNSVVAGATAALVAALLTDSGSGAPTLAAVVGFLANLAVTIWFGDRGFRRNLAAAEVRFADGSGGRP